jgi:transposase
MLGQHSPEQQQSLFSYYVNLEQRIGPTHPLREIKAALDLSFVVPSVRSFYGRSGNVSIDPEVIVKLMFLLFYYNIPSERELMAQLSYRMDFLWFLGFNLDTEVPDHSVLSKARARWGTEVFKQLFLQTVEQCVKAGLVDGRLLHVDSTMVKANASKDSLVQMPEFLAELYRQEERKLEPMPSATEEPTGTTSTRAVEAQLEVCQEPTTTTTMAEAGVEQPVQPQTQPKLEVLEGNAEAEDGGSAGQSKSQSLERVSLTDPEAQLSRAKNNLIGLCYKEHRLIDDAHGVITAMELTGSQVHDGTRLRSLTQQHEQNTQIKAAGFTLCGDQHYGTIENYRFCRQEGIRAHMAPAGAHLKERGLLPIERFSYEASSDRYLCPAGHYLTRLQDRPEQKHVVYRITEASLCAECRFRTECTKAKGGRTVIRHYDQQALDEQRAEALSPAGLYSRKRRKHVGEGSFADATQHGSQRARWRRRWRQQIQSWMVCAIQNLKVLLAKRAKGRPKAAVTAPTLQLLPVREGLKAKFGMMVELISKNLRPRESETQVQSG